MNENFFILIKKMLLKFVPIGLNDNKSALVQVMAWWQQVTSHNLITWTNAG